MISAGELAAADVVFASPHRALQGWGEALRIELPAPWVDHVHLVAEVLSRLGHHTEMTPHDQHADRVGPKPPTVDPTPGTGPVAFGALPFDRQAAATLVVPQRLVGLHRDGTAWITTIDPSTTGAMTDPVSLGAPPDGTGDAGDAGDAGDETEVASVAPEGHLTITAPVEPSDWCQLVEAATGRIRAGQLDKVVLARELRVQSDVVLDPRALLERLGAANPHSYRFNIDGFVGASPELLVARLGDLVRAHPMAGTTPRTGDPAVDHATAELLLMSDKNRAEHQITIDMVLDTLLGWTSYVDAAPAPSVVDAASVQHLATLVEGRLSDPPPSVLELVAGLHPTPAVGGSPRREALELIAELEPDERGRYAGPVGWVDAAGNGAWAVGLRSVSVTGRTASLWAGVGLVADSDPISELAETDAKFASTLAQLRAMEHSRTR